MAFGMSMKHSIVFLDRGTLGAELRAPGFPHSYQEYAATPARLVAERLRDATIAIINKVPMPAETLAQLPKLRLIAVALHLVWLQIGKAGGSEVSHHTPRVSCSPLWGAPRIHGETPDAWISKLPSRQSPNTWRGVGGYLRNPAILS